MISDYDLVSDLVSSGIFSTQLRNSELSLVSWFYVQLEMKHYATTCSIALYSFPHILVEWGGEPK